MTDAAPFAGKVALVTGGGSGIGRATAIELGRQGASVAVLSRQPTRIEAACAAVRAAGGQALGLPADVTQEADLAAAVQMLDDTWGRLDAVVVNAGINGVFAPLDELTLAEWNQTLTTNLTGTFLTTQASLPLLRRQGGAIVVVASVNGTRNFNYPGAVAYATSKAGQVAFTKVVARELAQQRIRINVVCPGAIRTNIAEATHPRHLDRIRWPVAFPQGTSPLAGGPADPAQVARVIAFLCSEAADHVSGTEVWVDGAESLLVG